MSFRSRLVHPELAFALAFTVTFAATAGENPLEDWMVVTPLTVPTTPVVTPPVVASEIPPPTASWAGELAATRLFAPATPSAALPIPPGMTESPPPIRIPAGIGTALESSPVLAFNTPFTLPVPSDITDAVAAVKAAKVELFDIIALDLADSRRLALLRPQAAPSLSFSGAEVFAARLARAGRVDQMTSAEAEGWLRVCAEGLSVSTSAEARNMYAERAWSFWRRARPNHGMGAFADWLDGIAPASEASRILLLARLANTGGDHAQCRNRLRPHIDDPAFAEHREEMLLLLGMAETQLEDPAARNTLGRLIAEYPNSDSVPRARLLLAWVCVMNNRVKEATELLHLVLASNPDATLARQARQMLAGLEEADRPAPPRTPAPAPEPGNAGVEPVDVF